MRYLPLGPWHASPCLRNLAVSLILGLLIAGNAFAGKLDLHKAVKKADFDRIQLLLARGVDINYQDRKGRTALMIAAGKSPLKVVKTLIEAGPEMNLQDQVGRTALMNSAIRGDPEVLRILVNNSADPFLTDKSGLTAQELAEQAGHIDIAEMLAFTKAKLLNTEESYSLYMRRYPEGDYLRYANTDLEWLRAKRANTSEAYIRFMRAYPKNEHIREAWLIVEADKWDIARSSDSVAGYREYLKLFPSAEPNSEHASQRIAEIIAEKSSQISEVKLTQNPQPFQGTITVSVEMTSLLYSFNQEAVPAEFEEAPPDMRAPAAGHVYITAKLEVDAQENFQLNYELLDADNEPLKMSVLQSSIKRGEPVYMGAMESATGSIISQGQKFQLQLLWEIDKNQINNSRIRLNAKECELQDLLNGQKCP